jgi:hypothetical protein
MHFRATYLVRELAIRTVDGGVANTYEDSEADFYLGGPHEIAIELLLKCATPVKMNFLSQ